MNSFQGCKIRYRFDFAYHKLVVLWCSNLKLKYTLVSSPAEFNVAWCLKRGDSKNNRCFSYWSGTLFTFIVSSMLQIMTASFPFHVLLARLTNSLWLHHGDDILINLIVHHLWFYAWQLTVLRCRVFNKLSHIPVTLPHMLVTWSSSQLHISTCLWPEAAANCILFALLFVFVFLITVIVA